MRTQQRALILEDESSLRTSLFRLLDRKGLLVVSASRIEEAQAFIKVDHKFDLAIIDVNLPDGNGVDFIDQFKAAHPQAEVLILSGQASIEDAVRATQKGAFHFVTKPFNIDELTSLIDKALTHKHLQQENQQLKTELGRKYKFNQIIGHSEPIQNVLRTVELVADTDSTILITGESGTGKELIAKAIHYNSSRAHHPFIPINCGAIPAELLESELFGHVKGAFTGAIQNRAGRFELADGGTIFLDEIGDLDPSLQVKLLRVLQEKIFEPVGGTKSLHVNIRVIAATNVDLEQASEQGRFREDLFYRLNVIPIIVPALRDRKSDIPFIFNHFMDIFNRNKNRNLKGLTTGALDCLMNYPWPGNIRELENLIERLSILKGEGFIDICDLPVKYQTKEKLSTAETPEFTFDNSDFDFNTAVDQFENNLILKALEKTGWNRNQAAILLRLNRTTLVEKIKKKGLRPPGELEYSS